MELSVPDHDNFACFRGVEIQIAEEVVLRSLENEHGVVQRGLRTRRAKFEEITRPWFGPITGSSFVEAVATSLFLPSAIIDSYTKAPADLSKKNSMD